MDCAPDQRLTFWAPGALPGVQAFHARFDGHRFGRHAHDGYVIAAMETGGETFDYRGRRFTALPGSLVLIDPEEPHTGEGATASPWSYRALYVGRSWFKGFRPSFAGPVVEDPGLFRRLCGFHASLERTLDPGWARAELRGILDDLAGRFARDGGPGGPRDGERPGLERVRRHLRLQFRDRVRLQDLADLAGVGRCHLVRAFKRATGFTPFEYLADLRVREAMVLLRQGQSATRVAADLGFADQAHFCRQFKRLVGIPPGRYARPDQYRSSAGASG
jgi:AraC-like DNA-binding protein